MRVIDTSRANQLPTGHVVVEGTEGHSDREVADLAGYCSRHFGFAITRDPEANAATVHLHND